MLLADHVSTVLANARLNEEVTLQKTLAETLLEAIPPGIVAIDEEAIVRWCNPTAETILGINAAEVLGKSAEAAGSRIAGRAQNAPLGFGRNPPPPAPARFVRRSRGYPGSHARGIAPAKTGADRSGSVLDRSGGEHVARSAQPAGRD